MMWRKTSLGHLFAHLVGKNVTRRVDLYSDPALPENRRGRTSQWEAADSFEAVELNDGTWIAIEFDSGTPYYSSWTPGSPGFTCFWIYQ